MKLTGKRRQELIGAGALISIKGREYIALDVLDTPVALAEPESAAAAEPARPTTKVVKVKDGGDKAHLEGAAGTG